MKTLGQLRRRKMYCKKCGVAIHKCSSADEYHPDNKMEYIKELNGSGCIHEPESGQNIKEGEKI